MEAEYNNLNIWYFVSFTYGIIVYFSLDFELSFTTIFFIFCACLILTFTRNSNIFLQFTYWMIIAFIFGVFISKYCVTNLHDETLHKPIITKISGNIESIKPTIIGGQVVLNNIKIEKINRNLQKVKISIPRKYIYSSEMQSDYMKINLERSNRSVSRGAERTEVREHPRAYKDDVANFGGPSSIKEIRVNNRITLLAKLYKPQNSILPGGYDFGFYAYLSDIGANGYAMSQPQIIERNETNFDSFIYSVRSYIYNNLIEKLGKDKGNFAAAILLGETKGLNRQIMQDMRQSGISHVLCVSGLHLSLVVMIIFVTTRFLLNLSNYLAYNFNIKLISAYCSLIGSFGYLELSGMQIAATRAFITAAIFIFGIIIGRSCFPLRSLAIAAFVILSLNPEYIFHPSFQLSFIAVLSLVAGFEFYLKKFVVNWGK